MAPRRPPDWFDRRGMQAWTEGMAKALRRRVVVATAAEEELVAAGVGGGEPMTLPLTVNGVAAGRVTVVPGDIEGGWLDLVRHGVETLQSLAEIRNSMTDLTRTTAQQWRELSLLYKFSDLLAGEQDPQALARLLVEYAHSALHTDCGALAYRLRNAVGFTPIGDRAGELEGLANWGAELEAGRIVDADTVRQLPGLDGGPPTRPVLVVPLRSGETSYGALVVASQDRTVFSAEDLKLASLLARQAGLAFANLELIDRAREHERIQRELEVAAEIQASILPPSFTETPAYEIAGTCLPAQWVGGDAFFVLPLADGLLTGVADVSGHGISSALLMNAFASEIEALSRTLDHPAELFSITNELISARVANMGLFVTAVLLRFWDDGSLSMANAGHLPPLIATDDGAVRAIETSSLPLGVMEEETFAATQLHAPVGGVVMAYSDGITEATGPDGSMYGIDRLRDSLRAAVVAEVSAAGVLRLVLEDLAAFEKGEARGDDLTVLVVRRTQ